MNRNNELVKLAFLTQERLAEKSLFVVIKPNFKEKRENPSKGSYLGVLVNEEGDKIYDLLTSDDYQECFVTSHEYADSMNATLDDVDFFQHVYD